MSSTDHPSILTVCVTDGGDAEGSSELHDILAARERALKSADAKNAASKKIASKNIAAKNIAAKNLAACDDSACGADGITGGCCGEGHSDSPGDSMAGSLSSLQMGSASFFHADSGKKALELLRMLRFDLLVTSDQLPDMPVSHLIRRVRAAWPWQKWAMVGSAISTQDEITARTLGAMAVFDAPPDWDALTELAEVAAARGATANHSIVRADAHSIGARSVAGVSRRGVSVAAASGSSRKAAAVRGGSRRQLTEEISDSAVG